MARNNLLFNYNVQKKHKSVKKLIVKVNINLMYAFLYPLSLQH